MKVLLLSLTLCLLSTPLFADAASDAARQQCERDKQNSLASCLSSVTNSELSCQSGCGSISDAGKYNDCKRDCSDAESTEREICYDSDRSKTCN